MDKDFKKLLIIFVIYGVLFIGFFAIKNTSYDITSQISNSEESDIEQIYSSENNSLSPEDNQSIYVHISGQVNYPGLLVLEGEPRLYEAIEKAGGMTDLADIDQINLAQILSDQEKIYIPSIEEEYIPENNNTGQTLVNINTASKEELMTLSGIGEKTAQSIIDYRTENRFNEIEDIMNVPGIGQGKFDQIKEQISK